MRYAFIRPAILGVLVGLTAASFAQTPTDLIPLELGKPQERELAVGQSHNYQIKMQAGQCARIEVEQRGINVLLNVFAPDGSYLFFADNQWNAQGVEEALLVAVTTGDFRLWVGVQAPPQAKIPPGKYAVRLAELRAATATDQLRYDATKTYSEMFTHGQKTDAEAKQRTLRAAETALRLFEELKDYRALVATHSFLQNYFQRLSDKPKTLEYLANIEALLPKLNDPKAQAERLIQNGVVYRGYYEWHRALASYEQAYHLFESIPDQDGMMRTLNYLARIHHDTFNYRKVIELRTKSLSYYRSQNARAFSAYLLQEIGRAYRNLGEYDKALANLQESLQIFQEIGQKEGQFDTSISIGYLYSLTARKTEAMDAFARALPLAQELGFTNEAVQVAVEIGKLHQQFREHAQAEAWLQKAAALPRSPKISRIPEGAALAMLGEFALTLGKEEAAVGYYQQAIEKAADFDNYFDKETAFRGLGTLYQSIKDFARLHETDQQRLRVIQKTGDKNREAEVWLQMAMAQMETDLPLEFWLKNDDRTKRAAEYLEQSRALRQAAQHPSEALPLAHLAIYYAITGDRAKALSYVERALRLKESLGIYEQRPVKSLVSQAYGFLGEPQTALELMRSVQQGLKDLPENNGLYHYYFAACLRASGLLSEAKEQLEQAIASREAARSQQKDQLVQTRIFASFAGLYDEYIDLLQQMHEQQPQQGFDQQAFLASERAHARSLLDTMTSAKVDVRLDTDPQLLAREELLRNKINTLAGLERAQQEKKLDAATLAATRKDLDEALEQLRRVQTQIRVASPRYTAVTQAQPPTLAEVQTQLLDADTMLLSYSLGKTRSHLWALTDDSLTSYPLPSRDEITKATRRVYDLLTTPQRLFGLTVAQQQKQLREAEQQYETEAAALSQMLLGPVAAQLGNKRLLIVAPEALQYLPFGALPDPVASSQLSVVSKNTNANRQPRTDNRQPLIVHHEIISLPSVSVMMLLRQELAKRKPVPKAVAVLADPVFEANDPRVKNKSLAKAETASSLSPLARSLRSFDARAGLARLILSREEAEAIAAAVPATQRLKALDFRASRTEAMSAELSQYRIVHFATHGLLNAERPELSGLVFSLVNEQGQPQDGFLRLHEIYNLQLPAELVVLSACQSGLGKDIKGEGMIGLTRGFMYAGAARVVASLWRVDDYATSVLIKKFYRGMLQEKLPATAALRKAQIEMWQQKQWQSPFYWGAFVLQGEWK